MRQTTYTQTESTEFKMVQDMEGQGLGVWLGQVCVCVGGWGGGGHRMNFPWNEFGL